MEPSGNWKRRTWSAKAYHLKKTIKTQIIRDAIITLAIKIKKLSRTYNKQYRIALNKEYSTTHIAFKKKQMHSRWLGFPQSFVRYLRHNFFLCGIFFTNTTMNYGKKNQMRSSLFAFHVKLAPQSTRPFTKPVFQVSSHKYLSISVSLYLSSHGGKEW